MAQVLGGESSSEEVAAAAQEVWQVLGALPAPQQQQQQRARLAALQPARQELEARLGGRFEDAALLRLAQQHAALRRWQAQLAGGKPGGSGRVGGGGSNMFAVKAGGLLDLPPELAVLRGMSPADAVAATLGVPPAMADAVLAGSAGGGVGARFGGRLDSALMPREAPRVATAVEEQQVEEEVSEGRRQAGRQLPPLLSVYA